MSSGDKSTRGQKVSPPAHKQPSTMSLEETPSRKQKIARVLQTFITKAPAEKRMQRCAARLALYEYVNVEDTYIDPDICNVHGQPTIFKYTRRERRLRQPTTTETVRSESLPAITGEQPRHIAIKAANDQDVRSEDVADRNIARARVFPPRVSSAAYVEKPRPAASPDKLSAKPKHVPLIPSGNNEDVADRNIAIGRGLPPRASSPAFVQKPQHAASPDKSSTKPTSVPLIPGDNCSAETIEMNLWLARMTESMSDAPKPLAVNKNVRFKDF